MLGVAPDATSSEIREAYRELARRLHPDRAGHQAMMPGPRGESMAAVNEAYRVLSDPGRRVVYDRTLGAPHAGAGRVPTSSPFGAGDEVRDESGPAAPPSRLSPAGPARVPWRLMGIVALIGSAAVLVSSFFVDSPSTEQPDGIIQLGSCVELEVNGDAREVACTGADDQVVVDRMVPLDGTCPFGTASHRDRLGMVIVCISA